MIRATDSHAVSASISVAALIKSPSGIGTSSEYSKEHVKPPSPSSEKARGWIRPSLAEIPTMVRIAVGGHTVGIQWLAHIPYTRVTNCPNPTPREAAEKTLAPVQDRFCTRPPHPLLRGISMFGGHPFRRTQVQSQ